MADVSSDQRFSNLSLSRWLKSVFFAGVSVVMCTFCVGAAAQCTASTPPGACNDVVGIGVDEKGNVVQDPHETGQFTGRDGACYAYEHRGFDGDRYTLKRKRIANYVGGKFNDKISSFRVSPGCKIVAWEHRDQKGAQITFNSDAEYVGDAWNDRISSFACRCQ
ncbi:beta/gamma crystallin domain-containing protein [Roseateles terrae]|uniref:Calcium-dependent cell adhesion molecule N-terminal domain-containing protein n=1 Tax=Roseateles terrae TaxID=431060 RepID=A0ABR6GTK3_9BURK|nr:beta/gamma crystallin domain-containing protein [Roseateles terrae]MBB3195438.1 hypothetical protein [Roseateles terrae]